MHYYILVINMNMYTSTNEKLGDVILKCRDTNRMQKADKKQTYYDIQHIQL